MNLTQQYEARAVLTDAIRACFAEALHFHLDFHQLQDLLRTRVKEADDYRALPMRHTYYLDGIIEQLRHTLYQHHLEHRHNYHGRYVNATAFQAECGGTLPSDFWPTVGSSIGGHFWTGTDQPYWTDESLQSNVAA